MWRRLVGGFAVVALGSTLLFARQGIVITRDGKTYQGDITERGDTIEITGVPGATAAMQFRKALVKVVYPDQIAAQMHEALQKLDRKDVKTRLDLAHSAMDDHAYDAAREAIEQALLIDPSNRAATDLLARLNRFAPPATQPATNPATHSATQPAGGGNTEAGPAKFVVKREVTATEMNRIRQIEWRKDEPGTISVQIDAGTKRKFLANHPETTPAEFNRMTPQEQAAAILSQGKPELRDGVHIRTDPPVMLEFKRNDVQRAILIGCAASNCHGGSKSGSFKLYAPPTNDLAAYTNFLVLQKYTMSIKGMERFLVDRQFPDQSLLLQFMLPLDVAETPHPKTPGFKPTSRTKSDRRYVDVLKWIQNLNPVAPEYGMDLSKPPPPKQTPGKQPAGRE